jgi:hypothetical protein
MLILQSLKSLVYYGGENEHEHQLLETFQRRQLIPLLGIFEHRPGNIGISAKEVLETIQRGVIETSTDSL